MLRRDRHGGDNCLWSLVAQGEYGGTHRRAGGHAVVDKKHGPAGDGSRRAFAAVEASTTGQFMLLLACYLLDQTLAETGLADDSLVEDLNAAVGNSPECQLALTGYAQLAYEKQVQVGSEDLCGFEGDRNTPSQQAKNERIY